MSADASTPTSGDNVQVFSVSEVSGRVKTTVEDAFGYVRVQGEISGFKRAGSGHLYFALKDEAAVLDGVCWRGTAARLGLQPEDGMEVIATGRITTYPGRSKYQIVVENMELAGQGALLKLLEERKKRLAEEGLFDLERKQLLPTLPNVIGVVTSPTGAVIRDILHRLNGRFPRRVLVWPVLVQGDGAADQVAAAIKGFNALDPDGDIPRPDLLIVARGGGSLEDLWAFNEEAVIRAASESFIPLISAIGHETDWTLLDLVADERAPTPTAAAEMAVPVRHELLARVADVSRRQDAAVRRALDLRKRELTSLARGLPNLRRLLEDSSQRLDDWSERLGNALGAGLRHRRSRIPTRIPVPTYVIRDGRRRVERATADLARSWKSEQANRTRRLTHAAALLESFSYERVLERGFALVTASDGTPVTSTAQAKPGDDVSIQFKDGSAAARIAGGAAPPPKKRKPKSAADDDPQGSLL
jgi:exodeoxyribonuclease VII large subunit